MYGENKVELERLIDLRQTANWRCQKAEKFPDDPRNLKAAELLSALADQLPSLEGSGIHECLIELWLAADAEDFTDTVSENLRAVGFYFWPNTAIELLEEIARDLDRNKVTVNESDD
jgi:hypothetical protein